MKIPAMTNWIQFSNKTKLIKKKEKGCYSLINVKITLLQVFVYYFSVWKNDLKRERNG